MLSFLNSFFSEQNQYITMFFSAFLSATLLPGNSEFIFTTFLLSNIENQGVFSVAVTKLLLIATVGNSLGSLITYTLGLLFPKPRIPQSRSAKWAFRLMEKYGTFSLLFSSLPIIGDLLCAMAGWLKLKIWQSILYITLGKLLRYLLLVATVYLWQ